MRTLLHLAFVIFRVLLLLPLLAALLSPRVVYAPVQSDDDIHTPLPTAASFLLPPESGAHPSTGLSPVAGLAGDVSKYGTFRTARSNLHLSVPTTRAPTPAPSNGPESKVRMRSYGVR
jgi:hypothetical protein